jgi:hypothetical protein
LTHDIDQIYFTKKEIGLSAAMSMAKHQVKSGLKTSLNMIRRWKPLWNFKDIMVLEEKYNAKSSFYFKVLNESAPEFNYRIEDLENELGNVIDKEWEVGLQGTNEAHESFEQVRKQKERIEKRAWLFRKWSKMVIIHFLAFTTNPDI